MIIATFKPSSPAVLPTPDLCFEGIRETKAQYALTHTKFMEVNHSGFVVFRFAHFTHFATEMGAG